MQPPFLLDLFKFHLENTRVTKYTHMHAYMPACTQKVQNSVKAELVGAQPAKISECMHESACLHAYVNTHIQASACVHGYACMCASTQLKKL